ncbi:undecaprenyl-diphosphate phosphatase [Aliidiomarina maris]|uniref:Undecaprenyl-diphosphatase n=1 Tax=Aliidiomarina maris TaxID=531312 RepID=A0A327WU97_9GAMM|nr:undecaprenyl-diphosphate phosphatase [Aliidiomarina maris]RAJ95256.1 undecaprenyl-diphosphatase [Aliidiomarina maris]RUO21047.1 undecaprenyl-diphosphatase [Aliidiomarina maris]
MDFIQIIVLALIQGLTEFLPVSSSAHLLLIPVFTAWDDQGLAFDVALHIGSLAAVILYFRQEIARMLLAWIDSLKHRRLSEDGKLAWAVILATIPVGLAGVLFNDFISQTLRSPIVVALGLIGFGILLGVADWKHRGNKTEYQMSRTDVLWIALAQALALIPGTSRSGITITAALFLGLSREAAARFSFLLSIPVIALAGGYETLGLVRADVEVDWLAILLGAVVAGVSAYLCIHYFLVFIRKIGMQPFVAYRVILGIILLWLFI